MLSFFFYGTLLDNELRELVIGRPVAETDIKEAALDG